MSIQILYRSNLTELGRYAMIKAPHPGREGRRRSIGQSLPVKGGGADGAKDLVQSTTFFTFDSTCAVLMHHKSALTAR